jgi:cytidylate kinase
MNKARALIRVAIDGPAGVGKTTTARTLARDLNLLYVDTGAMYRALAVKAMDQGISPDNEKACGELAGMARVTLSHGPDGHLQVSIDGKDVTREIRTDRASDGASRISVHPAVRRELVRWQQELARQGGVVMEGRDIGTVVLPDAEAKIFLTASANERARRRHEELVARGVDTTFAAVLRDIQERDARDQGRATSPLIPAPDAVVLDCTAFDSQGQVAAARKVVETLLVMRSGEFE